MGQLAQLQTTPPLVAAPVVKTLRAWELWTHTRGREAAGVGRGALGVYMDTPSPPALINLRPQRNFLPTENSKILN